VAAASAGPNRTSVTPKLCKFDAKNTRERERDGVARRCSPPTVVDCVGGSGDGEVHTKTTPNRVVPVQQEPRAFVCGFAVWYKRFHGLIIKHIIIYYNLAQYIVRFHLLRAMGCSDEIITELNIKLPQVSYKCVHV